MIGIRRLLKTTAFKLATIYLILFTVFAGGMIFYIASSTHRLYTTKLNERLSAELGELEAVYSRGGIRRLVRAIEWRSRRPDAGLYLITDPNGQPLAGNILDVPPDIFQEEGPVKRRITYTRFQEDEDPEVHKAVVHVYFLSNGFKLLVGRDVGQGERFREIFRRAFNVSVILMVLLGLATWLFVSRKVLSRVDSVAKSSKRIMAGHLDERLSVTGSGDEFDRLSINLNAMLDRIEALMSGLKDVSDNIAHDLKTPLTRMRNRVEAALRQDSTNEELREALAITLDESDQLIRIFDGLLKIASVEAGSIASDLERLNAADIVRDVTELYEPVAEDGGIDFRMSLPSEAWVMGNRELLGQAVANLLDNALKYAVSPDDDTHKPVITVAVETRDEDVLITVSDNGPGIPASDYDRVLQRFTRLEKSRSQPGSGLGLSLVAAVVRLFGGDIRLDDNKPGLIVELSLKEVLSKP